MVGLFSDPSQLPPGCSPVIPGILYRCPVPPPPVPGADLPPVDLPVPGADLPPTDLPDSGAAPDTAAEVETQSAAGTRDEVCTSGCVDCIAAQSGTIYPRRYSRNNGTQVRGYDYQHRVIRARGVANFFPHNPATGEIYEWTFAGVNFDGLVPIECHLIEAKFGHNTWFREDFSPGGRPTIRDDFIERVLMPQIHAEALRHYGAVRPVHPDVELTWYFSAMVFKLYMTEWFLGPLSPPDMSVVIYTQHLP